MAFVILVKLVLTVLETAWDDWRCWVLSLLSEKWPPNRTITFWQMENNCSADAVRAYGFLFVLVDILVPPQYVKRPSCCNRQQQDRSRHFAIGLGSRITDLQPNCTKRACDPINSATVKGHGYVNRFISLLLENWLCTSNMLYFKGHTEQSSDKSGLTTT